MDHMHLDYQAECELWRQTATMTRIPADSIHGYPEQSCVLFKRLQQMLCEYKELIENCQTLSSESPLTAFEFFQDTMGSFEFDAVYENKEMYNQLGETVRQAFENDGKVNRVGQFWISQRVVRDIVIGNSFLDWVGKIENMKTFRLSPYKVHFLVLNASNCKINQLLILLNKIYLSDEFYGGFYVPLIYCGNNVEGEERILHPFTEELLLNNNVLKLCIILNRGNYYIGPRSLSLIVFQTEQYQLATQMLTFSLNFNSRCLSSFYDIFKIIMNNLIKHIKIYQSRIYIASMNMFNATDEEENADLIYVSKYLVGAKEISILYFVYRFLICRTSVSFFMDFAKIIMLLFGNLLILTPVFNRYDVKIKRNSIVDYFYLQFHLNLSTFPECVSNILKAVVQEYDLGGDYAELSFEKLNKIPSFLTLIQSFEQMAIDMLSNPLGQNRYPTGTIELITNQLEQVNNKSSKGTELEQESNVELIVRELTVNIANDPDLPLNLKQSLSQVATDIRVSVLLSNDSKLYERYWFWRESVTEVCRRIKNSWVYNSVIVH